jgi:hypothetical protein
MKRIIIFIAILFTINACKQQDLPSLVDETPVFLFEGIIDSQAVLYEAGVNAYMNTNYLLDTSGRHTLIGNLSTQGCYTCQPAIELVILANTDTQVNNVYNYNPSVFALNTTLNSFSNGDTTFGVATAIVNLSATNNSQVTSYNWRVNGVVVGTTPNITVQVPAASNSTIQLITTSNGAIGDTVTQLLDCSSLQLSPLPIGLQCTVDSSNNLVNGSIVGYQPTLPGTINIDLGNGQQDTSSLFSAYYNNNGNYTISATLSNSGSPIQLQQKVTKLSFGTFRIPPTFSISVPQITQQVAVSKSLRSAYIKVLQNGKTYLSYKQNKSGQGSKPIVTINAATDGQVNAAGKRVKVLDVSADVYLYNINNTSDSIKFKSNKMIFAVATPL